MLNRIALVSALAILLPSAALAQTAVGVGVGTSSSQSASGAIAQSGSSITVNNPANTTARVESAGTTTVRTVPSMVAPGLTAAGLETCLGSASGTVSAVGFGIGGGSTYKDEDCTARLDSRTLFAMGLKGAAVARLCQRPDIWRSMPDVCEKYWPAGQAVPYGIVVAPRGVVMSAEATGPLEVIDGKTGQTRLCDRYDPVKYKCHKWQGEAERTYTRTRAARTASLPPTAAAPKATKKPAPLPTLITEGKTAETKKD
jgi:hypothetical protein